MLGRNVVHQMIVFFTCKNLLVVILQLYRLAIIATTRKDQDEEKSKETEAIKNLKTLKTVAVAATRFSKITKDKEPSERKSSKVFPKLEHDIELPVSELSEN